MNLVLRGAAEIVGLALSLLTTVWVSRTIDPAYFGYFAVMTTLIMLGSIFVNVGLSTAGSQRVANAHEHAGEICWALVVARTGIAMLALVLATATLDAVAIDLALRSYLAVGLVARLLVLWRDGVLIPPFEEFGAAWATVAAKVAVTLAAIRHFRRATDYPLVRDLMPTSHSPRSHLPARPSRSFLSRSQPRQGS